jgi:hypothetical protein
MRSDSELRIEPSEAILGGVRQWLEKVRPALGAEFAAAYVTGSALTQGFDPKKSHVNVLVVARALGGETLDAVAKALPPSPKTPPRVAPLFMTLRNIEKSLDTFPIEWIDIQERHLLIEGEDVLGALEVPQTYLRLQCEHDLRGKLVQLRQAYLHHHGQPAELQRVLEDTASGFATLFRTLLRLRAEPVPANPAHAVERVADLFQVDAQGLLVPHLVRYVGSGYSPAEIVTLFRKFLAELDRLVIAIDQLRTA